MVHNNVIIGVCIAGMVVTGSVQAVTILMASIYFESLFFILLMTSVQFVIFFGVAYLIVMKGKIQMPEYKLIVILSGVFSALMSILKMYASNPARTPAVMQSILSGLSILPNVLMTKLILKKTVRYDKRFIIPSVILMLASIGISCIPIVSSWDAMAALWITIYVLGIISTSVYCVMQEKYFIETADGSVKNKIVIMFYTRLVHLITVILFCWLEWVIGYSGSPLEEFGNSFIAFFTNGKDAGYLQGFIMAYLVFYTFSAWLNSISSNYNMMATIAVGPSIAIFFTAFPNFNPGIKYPWYVVIPALVCSVASIVLWVVGEKNDGYTELKDANSVNP